MRSPLRHGLLIGASVAALAAAPALAQTAQTLSNAFGRGGAAGAAAAGAVGAAQARPPIARPLGLIRDQGAAATRQSAVRARLNAAVSMATQAQSAARAAAAALPSGVARGLRPGGLFPAVPIAAIRSGDPLLAAARDETGVRTWQGALAPTEAVANGVTTVTIQQTEQRAVLSWDTFNVSRDTRVDFLQGTGAIDPATGRNATPRRDWIALNRIVGGIDPETGLRDRSLAPTPSQILGRITADGTVLVINPNGVIFGGASVTRTRGLIVSSLEIGRPTTTSGAIGIAQRNREFLQFGLLGFRDQANANERATAQEFSALLEDDLESGAALEGRIEVAAGADLLVGDITVDPDTRVLQADGSGLLLLIAPRIANAGSLAADAGQVSLIAGRNVSLRRSTDVDGDPAVRGLLATAGGTLEEVRSSYSILNSGVIASPRGYLAVTAANNSAIAQNGVLTSTTSVSRNGAIDLLADNVRLGVGSTIAITADEGGETIPRSATSFRASRVRIGPANIEMARDALIHAPGGEVTLGPTAAGSFGGGRVFIDTGATIDVGGIKDVEIPASRNTITIGPLKRNDLRDTPNYREVLTAEELAAGRFTLNGATISVDPRRTGVRADGVAWIGSPLIEAGSYADQVGVGASELLTRGGSVTLGSRSFAEFGAGGARNDPAGAADVIVKAGATIDVSGGWTRFAGGTQRTSQLITAGGQLIDIAEADPNGDYVGVVTPFEESVTRFGFTRQFSDELLLGGRTVAGYTEGRDAGAFLVRGAALAFDGVLRGEAYAGDRQRSEPVAGTRAPVIAGDQRLLQSASSQLPAGALFTIETLSPGGRDASTAGDIAIVRAGSVATLPAAFAYGQSFALAADGAVTLAARPQTALLPAARRDRILLGDGLFEGLGQVTLQTSGALSLAAGTQVRLAPLGVFEASTGRAMTIAGAVIAAGGTIDLATYNIGQGSAFADDPVAPGSFDVTVTGTGSLSAAGRFVNDLGRAAAGGEGAAALDGGSVSIAIAPRVTLKGATPNDFIDASGSIVLEPGALIDVAGGARVAADGAIETSSRGGDVALINETNYFQLTRFNAQQSLPGNVPGLRVTPIGRPLLQADNPASIRAQVRIAPGSVRGHGFAGGGSFTLTTPAFAFGDTPVALGTALPRDFFGASGFGRYEINVFKTALFANRFVNSFGGTNALLETERVVINAGETLDLTQARFSPLLTPRQTAALRGAATGGDVYAALTPARDAAGFDQLPVALAFGGLVELDVRPGGRVRGAAGGSISVAKLRQAGTIDLPGGTIAQVERLLPIYALAGGIGVRSLSEVFAIDADGAIREEVPNAAGIIGGDTRPLTNAEVANASSIYLLGALDQGEGARFEAGAITDLSGVALFDPRATDRAGRPIVDGRLVAGGALSGAAARVDGPRLFETARFGRSVVAEPDLNVTNNVPSQTPARSIVALPGTRIDLSGAAASFARADATGALVPTPQWSDGGLLAARGGSRLLGATILADGGAPLATGGTLIARAPRLSQGQPEEPENDIYVADAIMAQGFDTFVAEGGLDTLGDVTLRLGRGFFVRSAPFDGLNITPAPYGVRLAAEGLLDVSAPIIRFDSITQAATALPGDEVGEGFARFRANAIDIEGAVVFDSSIGRVRFEASDAFRLIGAQTLVASLIPGGAVIGPDSRSGQLLVADRLEIAAGQVYATTGSSFTVAAEGEEGSIAIERLGAVPATPYSAGSALTVQAATITQGGVVRAPVGTLTLGGNTPLVAGGLTPAPATSTLTLPSGSVTSVSANGLSIPYGTTTDQREYFFTPTIDGELTAPPRATLRLSASAEALAAGATIDLTGGGDLLAYEFIPGIGGSRDVLDRLNSDFYSSNDGRQYPDGRQVYAIVPSLRDAGLATFDPIQSADYDALLAPEQAGRRVFLEAAEGLAAGWYTLLPARYALLPGGLRVVEQPEYGPALPGSATTLRDGTRLVTGYYGTAGTALAESERRVFAVAPQPTVRAASQIALTSANTAFTARAARVGVDRPRLPIDAGRLILEPIESLTANASFLTTPGIGGRAATADVAGERFQIVAAPVEAPEGTIVVTAQTLNNLRVASLLIGGTRVDNADGTTNLLVTARSIELLNDAASALVAPEILLAVDGDESNILFADGAVLRAAGAADTVAGDYIVNGASAGMTGNGALVRVATGAERRVRRVNVETVATPAELTLGAARVEGRAVLLDSSGALDIASVAGGTATIVARDLGIGAGAVAFAAEPVDGALTITPALAAAFAAADRLTIRSAAAIGFEADIYRFGALALDTPGLALLGEPDGLVTLRATGALDLSNSGVAPAGCTVAAGPLACGGGSLALEAASLRFGSGRMAIYGFGASVAITAPGGTLFDGVGAFDAGPAALSLVTPFIADRALALAANAEAVALSLTLTTTGAVTITAPAGAPVALAAGTPGARLAVAGSAIAIDGARLRATAGTLDLTASAADPAADRRAIALTRGAIVEAPAFARVFGDADDPYSVAAPGGRLRLSAALGGIGLAAGTRVSVGGAAGEGGTLELFAAQGVLDLGGVIAGGAPARDGRIRIDTAGAVALARLIGAGFGGGVSVRAGTGDLVLAASERLAAADVRLVADEGGVAIDGIIDTSGINGGRIALFGGAGGVTLGEDAELRARASGYAADDSRQAEGGDVTLGTTGAGAITLTSGARIDVTAERPGDRFVAQVLAGQTYYRVAESDVGGTVTMRAPVVAAGGVDTVAISVPDGAAAVLGARETVVEGYRRWDLAEVAAGGFTGVTLSNGDMLATLDTRGGQTNNFLAGTGPGTIPSFVRGFDISASYAALGVPRPVAGEPVPAPWFTARPGVELAFAGDVRLASNWNFAAATIDVARARDAGLIVERVGTPALDVVVRGREGELLAGYADFLYRVGGRITGAAGALTLRAEGTVTIAGDNPATPADERGGVAISDGFFTFGDQTEAEYLRFVTNRGTRVFEPVLRTFCLNTPCAVVPFNPAATTVPRAAITVAFVNATPGAAGLGGLLIDAPAPYVPDANGAAAAGNDPLGGAQIFPLIDGAAPASWSYTLVAGAADGADPSATDSRSTAALTIAGERSYTFGGPSIPSVSFRGALTIDANVAGSGVAIRPVPLGEFAEASGLDPNAFTAIGLTGPATAVSTLLRTRADAFFANQPAGSFRFIGPVNAPTQVTTTLATASAFLGEISAEYQALVLDRQSGVTPASGAAVPLTTNFVRSFVRTGTGAITVAAAGDIDLRGTLAPVLRASAVGATPVQVGGAAIYTAGGRVAPSARSITDPANGIARRVDLAEYRSGTPVADGPSLRPVFGALPADPVLADGGGDLEVRAGGDILGRRDVQGGFRIDGNSSLFANSGAASFIGAPDQVWRVGSVDQTVNIRINPQLFQSGLATLGGGDIRVVAGRDLSDLTIVAATSVTTADATRDGLPDTRALLTYGGGDLALEAGRDLLGGLVDVGEGEARLRAARDVASAGITTLPAGNLTQQDNALRLRVTDTDAEIVAGGQLLVRGIAALGAAPLGVAEPDLRLARNQFGFYTPAAGVALRANNRVTTTNAGADVSINLPFTDQVDVAVYPGSFEAASITADLRLSVEPERSDTIFLYPSRDGQLRLFAGARIAPVVITMDDGDPGQLPGAFSRYDERGAVVQSGRFFSFPAVLSDTSETERAQLHNPALTHRDNPEPVRVAALGDIERLILAAPKQTRLSAGRDLIDAVLIGQNIANTDVTRVTAGRDIIGTTRLATVIRPPAQPGEQLPAVQGNSFILGGPGAFFVEAGRNAGPFLNSANAVSAISNGNSGTALQSYGGGVLSVGNEYNPFLPASGADVFIQFGTAGGLNYAGLRETYLNPANEDALEDEVFEQNIDAFGRPVADRSRPIYAPLLIEWVRANAAAEIAATDIAPAALTVEQAYAIFEALPQLRQRAFLLQEVYFNELQQTGVVSSVSYLRYSRGYRAVNILLPPERGYTRNDLSGGGGTDTVPILTGDLDLRLATVQTARGGDLTILGPGGSVLGGSTVRTEAQAARRAFVGNRRLRGLGGDTLADGQVRPAAITSIPTGFEGFLTLRGGRIFGFVDGDFLLNQSRLFTQAGGNIALWSSNGDLNAGQGPRTSANFPPVVLRIGVDGGFELDALGGVSGAGIAAFQPAVGVAAPDVFLIAPRGQVDLGDAGVRVAGSLSVAAASVANADNAEVGGSAFGIPAGPTVNVGAQSAGSAVSAAAAAAAADSAGANTRRQIDPLSRISVDVLGYYGSGDPCDQEPRPADCPAR